MRIPFLPREEAFFDLFEAAASNIHKGAQTFLRMVGEFSNFEEMASIIKDVEHEGDRITHEAMRRLHGTFITPFDREDIHEMVNRLDDILDGIDAAAQRLVLFNIQTRTYQPQLEQMAVALDAGVSALERAIRGLRNTKESDPVLQTCIEIHDYENRSDDAMREALGMLFGNGEEPLELLKWKELLEIVEQATDRVEDVANVIEGIVVKHA
ncbi:MAG: DUF47 domain-containing protein [Nitrospinota bacterium]